MVHVFVVIAIGLGWTGCQEHGVHLGLEERACPRFGNWTLRQSTTFNSVNKFPRWYPLVTLLPLFQQIFDICWDPFQTSRLVSCGVKHIKARQHLPEYHKWSDDFCIGCRNYQTWSISTIIKPYDLRAEIVQNCWIWICIMQLNHLIWFRFS